MDLQAFETESEAEESLIATVHMVVQSLSKRPKVLIVLAGYLGKLITSTLPAQRGVAVAFYAELLGKVDCDAIWLDAVINSLHEARADSSPMVRKLATIGLTRVACLEPKQVCDWMTRIYSSFAQTKLFNSILFSDFD